MNFKAIALLVFLSLLTSVHSQSQSTFHIQLVALWTADLKQSVEWYTNQLEFEIEREITEYPDYDLRIAFLKKEEFHLELLEKGTSYHSSEVLPSNDFQLGGIGKLGFIVKDIDSVYNKLLSSNQVEFVTEIGTLSNPDLPIDWPNRYFLIEDPDGNFLQFFTFENDSYTQSNPWLIMITTPNLETSLDWYRDVLSFEHLGTFGETGNKRAILSRNNLVLELFEPRSQIHRESISSDTTILGFNKIGLWS